MTHQVYTDFRETQNRETTHILWEFVKGISGKEVNVFKNSHIDIGNSKYSKHKNARKSHYKLSATFETDKDYEKTLNRNCKNIFTKNEKKNRRPNTSPTERSVKNIL